MQEYWNGSRAEAPDARNQIPPHFSRGFNVHTVATVCTSDRGNNRTQQSPILSLA